MAALVHLHKETFLCYAFESLILLSKLPYFSKFFHKLSNLIDGASVVIFASYYIYKGVFSFAIYILVGRITLNFIISLNIL